MAKKAMIIEESGRTMNKRTFQVKQLKNSIEYTCGEYLEKEIVESLCTDPAWDVTIKPLKR